MNMTGIMCHDWRTMENTGRITAVERQKKNKSRVSIFVDDGYLGSADDIVWVRSGLKTGDMLSSQAWEDMQGRQEEQAAMEKALRYLALRARGKVEMERYLKEKGYAVEAVEKVITRLEELSYLNDGAFAGMLVRDRVNLKGAGRQAIAVELKQQGIDDETAAEALLQYGEEEETEAARRQAAKAFHSTGREQDQKKRRAKVYSSLARRGFSSHIIQTVLNELFNVADSDSTEF
jgi:regulatory protein